jgi:sn1-specific diacylglycerol lipase
MSLQVYLYISLAMQIIGFVIGILMMWVTLRGTVANEKPRAMMGTLASASVCIKVPELVLHIFAITVYFTSSTTCSPRYFNFVVTVAFTISSLIILLFVLSMMVLMASTPFGVDLEDRPRHFQRAMVPVFAVPLAMNRRHADFNGNGSVSNVLGEVAKLLSDLFEDGHICVSDVLVGMMLVKKKQVSLKRRIVESYKERRAFYTPVHSVVTGFGSSLHLDPNNCQPFHRNIKHIAHFVDYACSVYGKRI